jgi:GntR family L-lactate dehydrogenase operon transcriptional regulator
LPSTPPDLERLVLTALLQSDGPAGAWRISALLREAGVEVGEATVGRLLHDLDRRDLTERDGNRGRVLSVRGAGHLKRLNERHDAATRQLLVVDALDWQSRVEALDLLYVRRGIEREAARLAAKRCTRRNQQRLQRILERHSAHAGDSSDSWEDGWAFHQAVAVASQNKLVISLFDLFSVSHSSLGQISHKVDQSQSSYRVEEHEQILEAIAEHDPDAAEHFMSKHLTAIIEDFEAALRSEDLVSNLAGAHKGGGPDKLDDSRQ